MGFDMIRTAIQHVYKSGPVQTVFNRLLLGDHHKRQVGALIVKDKMIISDGYNGTPTGFENICEDEEGYTKWYVLHAEANAILKVASSTQSCEGATLYITMSPCKQ